MSFQGYEVTLPASWPYLEAVFRIAMRHEIDRSFITNGMLLSRWTERVRVLEPSRISISIDGADAKTNDALRGVRGALDATVDSVTRFLTDAPDFNDRVAIASTLYLSKNLNSLKRMPALPAQARASSVGSLRGIRRERRKEASGRRSERRFRSTF